MKRFNPTIFFFIGIVVLAALYRTIPFESRPIWLGAPQLALALFAGSVVKNRKWAFALPIFSLFLSDLLMQALFSAGLTPGNPGFYAGQLMNYGFIALLTVVGFFVNYNKVGSILGGMFSAPTLYFLLSNFAVWAGGGGFNRPKTFAGLMQCYTDGLPFYGYSLLSMGVFGTALFISFHLFKRVFHSQAASV